MAGYDTVSTLENLQEFQAYALLLAEAGYYVPRNWIWLMHSRPKVTGRVYTA